MVTPISSILLFLAAAVFGAVGQFIIAGVGRIDPRPRRSYGNLDAGQEAVEHICRDLSQAVRSLGDASKNTAPNPLLRK